MGKPVLLTVDDDPAVSRAVARDLRRQLRRGLPDRARRRPGAEALDALRELKLRGEPVAAILADYRMPRDERHRVPRAGDGPRSRAPAARCSPPTPTPTPRSQAINVVDVDHYLLKPWDPPEEKLYPVVDALLETWRRRRRPRRSTRPRWSATAGRRASFEVRDFLARNAVPYRWYNVDEPEGAAAAGGGRGRAADDVPVVVTAGRRPCCVARPTPSSPPPSG